MAKFLCYVSSRFPSFKIYKSVTKKFIFIYLFIYICLYTVKKHQVNNTYILQVIIKINTDNKN